jgi:hypothetical protein
MIITENDFCSYYDYIQALIEKHSQFNFNNFMLVILKSVIVCICGEVPLNITISNVALKAGELELIFLNSHAPDSIHRTLSSGRLELPYCRLAIVPNLEPDICGCCACVIDIMLDDVIVTTTAATTIIIGSLVINVYLLLGVTKKY